MMDPFALLGGKSAKVKYEASSRFVLVFFICNFESFATLKLVFLLCFILFFFV